MTSNYEQPIEHRTINFNAHPKTASFISNKRKAVIDAHPLKFLQAASNMNTGNMVNSKMPS